MLHPSFDADFVQIKFVQVKTVSRRSTKQKARSSIFSLPLQIIQQCDRSNSVDDGESDRVKNVAQTECLCKQTWSDTMIVEEIKEKFVTQVLRIELSAITHE
jgi:hypothetical protein